MKSFSPALAAAFLALAGPAAADCGPHLDLMDEVLDRASRESIAASSGGQGVAGAREARAMTETEAPGEDETGMEAAEDPEPQQAPGHAAPAEAGARVQQLRASVDEARAQDATACRETLVTALADLLADQEEQE
ncbi:hypothetical protein [Paracoccus aerius]|uniref:Uncharacterized protein n=2 Tax=Paracoccus aerius TaxID=1915382 RepID=A0ABS1S640_9RHOB|nr:hypothetical protein [Paracoccus aerius]MBL3674198.1 hypothetical protein [Paracoccus aerius]GHG21674.1 hypothetical protein GCM10017322_18990 [Paracoccus aerius]